MFQIIILCLFALAAVLGLMWLVPAFRNKVTGWGTIGAALTAILAWIVALFSDVPALPPS